MSKSALALAAWTLASAILLGVVPLAAQEGHEDEQVIGDIVVEGGVTLTVDTVSYYLGLEPGDPMDRLAVADGFHRLWESGLFEEVRIEEATDDAGEVTLYVTVEERPFVTAVVFEGNKKLNTSTLKDKLDEKGIEIPRNVPLRMAQVERIGAALDEIYDNEGYRSAAVSFDLEEVSTNRRRIVFDIEEGAKVKIEKIEFVGNEVFSDSRLRRVLKKMKAKRFYRPWGKKIIFAKEAWEEDRENLREFYLNHGYKDVKIGQPATSMRAKKPKAKSLKDRKYRLTVTVPVEEGEPYSIGSLRIEGVTVFDAERLTTSFEVEEGETYEYKAVKSGMENIRDLYHNMGYIYAYTNQVLTDREDADHVVDVVVDVFEGDRFRLGRLEFRGNTSTKDKVLRREFRISEGNWMSMGVFRSSVFKVNALGYWKLEEEPLEFDFDDENKRVNVVVKGNEVGRNDIQFGAGYSELDGFFGQARFNTRNFLGRGESLGVSLQLGRRTDYYTLSYSDPYFLDRRILLGGSIFNTSLDINDFFRETTGASLSLGLGVGTFSSVSAVIAYEDVESRFAVSRSGVVGQPTGGHRRPIEFPPEVPVEREITFEEFAGNTTSITPAWGFDSRDDPFDPNRGRRIVLRSRFAGGPLGGDFDYIRPEVTFTLFKPLTKKTIGAINVEAGQVYIFNDSEIPLYERYRLGGDRSLRGIPYYTVLPRDEEGNYFFTPSGSREGGDRYWLLNFEYQFRVGGPVKLVLFTDLGNTYHEDQGWVWDQYRHTTGVELRVFLPIFQAPIRFIYGYNLDPYPEEDTSDFEFSIGTTF